MNKKELDIIRDRVNPEIWYKYFYVKPVEEQGYSFLIVNLPKINKVFC